MEGKTSGGGGGARAGGGGVRSEALDVLKPNARSEVRKNLGRSFSNGPPTRFIVRIFNFNYS